MNRNRWKKTALICFVIGALVFSFWYGGNAPGLRGFSVEDNKSVSEVISDADNGEDNSREDNNRETDVRMADESTESVHSTEEDNKDINTFSFKNLFMKIKQTGSSKKASRNNPQYNKAATKNANKSVEKNKKKKSKKNTSASKNDNSEIESSKKKVDESIKNTNNSGKSDTDIDENKDNSVKNITCSIDITCASVLKYMDKLNEAKRSVIPEDGVILHTVSVEVKEGDTVFEVLQKAARENKVHLEYNYTPAYKTYYIEGIGNLYQFDAGNLSGWMYSVNGEFPGVGCSGYKVNDGDAISWVYTCSFGKDVGGYVDTDD